MARKKSRKKTAAKPPPGRLSQARTLALMVLAALSFRAFAAEAYVIPSGSMMPTLQVGDRIVVDKHVYGLKVPFLAFKLTGGRAPRAGEVAVFMDPREVGPDMVKRIVAVGGDEVSLRDNVVLVNGREAPREPLPGPCTYLDYEAGKQQHAATRPCQAYEERLGGVRYRVFQNAGAPPTNFGPVRVPKGQVFMLGDNRDNSNDSRYWGTVPHSHLKGRALAVGWSWSAMDGVRWERWFSGLSQ